MGSKETDSRSNQEARLETISTGSIKFSNNSSSNSKLHSSRLTDRGLTLTPEGNKCSVNSSNSSLNSNNSNSSPNNNSFSRASNNNFNNSLNNLSSNNSDNHLLLT